jgi:hypothetical protein
MKELLKNKKLIGLYTLWFTLHLVLLIITWGAEYYDTKEKFWPIQESNLSESYDLTEFFIYTAIPFLLIFSLQFFNPLKLNIRIKSRFIILLLVLVLIIPLIFIWYHSNYPSVNLNARRFMESPCYNKMGYSPSWDMRAFDSNYIECETEYYKILYKKMIFILAILGFTIYLIRLSLKKT